MAAAATVKLIPSQPDSLQLAFNPPSAEMLEFINLFYMVIWKSDPVSSGEIPTLYILTDCHFDDAALKCNAQFIKKFGNRKTKLFIEGVPSGVLIAPQEHRLTKAIATPIQITASGWDIPLQVQASGWDMPYTPPAGQFQPEILTIWGQISRALQQFGPAELEAAERPYRKSSTLKPKRVCDQSIICLSKIANFQPTTCTSQTDCLIDAMQKTGRRYSSLLELMYAATTWEGSAEGVYERNRSLLNTLEKANVALAPSGEVHFAVGGAAHVIYTIPEHQKAVNLVLDKFKHSGKVVILEPKSVYEFRMNLPPAMPRCNKS